MREIPSPPIGAKLKLDRPFARGLIGAWLFNEGSGNKVHDYSEQGKIGTQVGNPIWVGDGLDFSVDAVDIGANAYAGISAEMTLVFLCRPDAYTTYPRFIDKYPGPSLMCYDNGTDYYCQFYGTVGASPITDTWNLIIANWGTWVTLAVRLGSGFQEIYINGKLLNAQLSGGPYSGAYSDGGAIVAGLGNRISDMARDFDGVMKYAYIYNRVLSAQEIAILYAFPYAMFEEESPYQFWKAAGGAYTLDAGVGTYAVAGQAVDALLGRNLDVGVGTYALAGQAAGVYYGRKINSDAGAYTVTGQAVETLFGRKLDAGVGAYDLTGQELGLLLGRKLDAGVGVYNLTGQDLELLLGRMVVAESGSYALTGLDVTLTYTPTGGYTFTLDVEPGAYALAGQSIGLLKGSKINVEAGAYVVTGQDAAVLMGRKLDIEPGAFAITGQDVSTFLNRILQAGAGSYILTGSDATLTYSAAFVSPIIIHIDGRAFIRDLDKRLKISRLEVSPKIRDVDKRR